MKEKKMHANNKFITIFALHYMILFILIAIIFVGIEMFNTGSIGSLGLFISACIIFVFLFIAFPVSWFVGKIGKNIVGLDDEGFTQYNRYGDSRKYKWEDFDEIGYCKINIINALGGDAGRLYVMNKEDKHVTPVTVCYKNDIEELEKYINRKIEKI